MPLLLILTIWRAAVIVKLIAACRIMRAGIHRRFPLLLIWLSLAALRSLILMSNVWPRSLVYTDSAPLLLGLESSAVVEVFREANAKSSIREAWHGIPGHRWFHLGGGFNR